jgi:hypothetical protein
MYPRDMSRYPASDKQPLNSRTITHHRFIVEARHNYRDPLPVGDQIFDREWRVVNFNLSDNVGIPVNTVPGFEGTLSYAAAPALRWWWLAQLEATTRACFCMETRLVQIDCVATHKQTAVGYIDPLTASGGIPDDMRLHMEDAHDLDTAT